MDTDKTFPGGVYKLTLVTKAGKTEVKDDRPADNISFAATNLVKPGIQSRRQQSEPPNNRNVFPPTPPPENDRPSRGASVRNGPKPALAKLNIQQAEPQRRYEKANSATSPPEARQRPMRSASATPNRSYSQREPAPMQRRPTRQIQEEDAYPDELYDMYQGGGPRGSRGSQGRGQGRPRQQPRYVEEEEDGSDYDDGSFDEGDFEMVSNNRRAPSTMSGSSRAASRRPEVRKIRVKVHADDVRYIMVGAAVEFPDFVDRIRDKFGLRRRFKIKVKDEDMPDGDMITMGDQDDLDMVIMSTKSLARKQRQEIGKMEVRFN